MLQARDDAIEELLDQAGQDTAALRRSLRDIRRINAMLGWTAFTARAIERYVRRAALREVSVLDVASGSADIPAALARWAVRAGVDARIVATDINPEIVSVARAQTARLAGITVERQDALALPYPPASFSVALCTLALHHFAPDDAVDLLRGLARVGRHVFVFDLVRSPLAYVGAVALTRLACMDPMTRHDAPASVRRGYTAAELRQLVARADLRQAVVQVDVPFRLLLEAAGSV